MPATTVYLYRADPSTLKAIKRWAADELRSSNSQIEYLLREALRLENRLPNTQDHHAESSAEVEHAATDHAATDHAATGRTVTQQDAHHHNSISGELQETALAAVNR